MKKRPINRLVSAILPLYYNARCIDDSSVLVKFLNDFVVGVDSLVIETYYAPPGTRDTSLRAPGFSSQWKGTISFLGILEVSDIYHRADWYASCEPCL